MEKANVICFGNCQAEVVAIIANSHPELSSRYTFHFLQSFAAGDLSKTVLPVEIIQSASLLLEQVTPFVRFPHAAQLPSDCRIVTYPSVESNFLWPLNATDPRNKPEPGYPFGRYPYGDRIINDVVARGLSGNEAWDAYIQQSTDELQNVSRLVAIEQQRWSMFERNIDVQMSNEVFNNFRVEKLFHAINHPSALLTRTLLSKIFTISNLFDSNDFNHVYNLTSPFVSDTIFANNMMPVHPEIARLLGLEWWSRDLLFSINGEDLTFEESVRRQIDWG